MSAVRHIVRPAVLREIPLDRHVVIDASAGTGKTFTLENLVVELVLSTDLTIDRLLCVTFTEKATHEIRARVRAKLQALIAGRGEPATASQVRNGDAWTLDDRGKKKLEAALHAFDAATIATIHAFCHRVLRENAFASGRCFEERQVDGREAFGRAFRDALRGDVTRDPSRARWLEAALRSGWSIGRIEELLWNCARERAPLRPAFEPAALDAALAAFPTDEAREPRILGELKAWSVHARTASTIVGALSDLSDLVEKARAASDAPLFVREAKDVVGKLRDRLQVLTPRPGRAARVVAAALDLTRATPPFPAAIAHALIESVQRELARGKRAAGRYDFDDMLSLVDDALRGPRGGALAEAMRQRWRYALIDEFQDTDETQWSIFRRAFFERAPGRTPGVLLVVGDPKQSIYRFRGADVETYLAAGDEVRASGGARVRLGDNYRATPDLVAATNRFFDQDAPAPFFTGEIKYESVACGRPDRKLVDDAGAPLSPMCALRFEGAMPLPTLGAWIAREARRAADPERPWRLDGRPLAYGDVFVLTRTGKEGRQIGKALRAEGVPHAFYKEDGLFQTQQAKDLRALLAAIEDPDDASRRVAAWLTPFFGLPLVEVERARGLSAAHPLLARLYGWKALADARDFGRLFQSIVRESGFVRREIFFADGERDLTNTLHILELLTERARGGRATLRDLVQELSGLIARTRLPLDLEGNMQRLESDRSAVQIMTIHKAKGLEAPLVFLAGGLSAGGGDGERVRVFHEGGHRLAWVGSPTPDVKALVDGEEEEEEQRLMYVALTRAMGRLYLPCVLNPDGQPKSLRGPYDPVNQRVAALVRLEEPLITTVDMIGENLGKAEPHAGATEWRPSPDLLHDDHDERPYAALRERHAPAVVTSYTRMRGERPRVRAVEPALDRRTEKGATAVDDVSTTTLRAARASGIFLHELLERVPLGSFAARGSLSQWREREDVVGLFDEAVAAHRIDPVQRPHAEELVWTAYTTPVALPGGGRLDGFAAAKVITREMEFVYPIPQAEHPALGTLEADRALTIAHGYVRGSLDIAFEHEGLTYFADWKSDSLASYRPEALAGHVAAHYLDQAKLYALAVVKLLGVHSRVDHEARFGGLLYCFLRGFGEAGGLWSSRPSWDEIVAWDQGPALPTPLGINVMRHLVPIGTALERWRAKDAGARVGSAADSSSVTASDLAPIVGAEVEDVQPAYFGWEIARSATGLSAAERRVLAALAAACVGSMRAGSTRLPLDTDALSAALAVWGASDALSIARGLLDRARAAEPHAVQGVIGRPGERKPLVVDGEWLYAERMHALEERFCARILERAARTGGTLGGRALTRAVAAVAGGPPALTTEQQRAVREVLATPFALITGGPGTGKTATAVAMLRAIAWIGTPMAQLAIAAPTGKAAQRLADAITLGLSQSRDLSDVALATVAPAPQTLHRLLGWSPSRGRFARHENDPLPYRFVLVDEASMIDLAMMDRLVRALRPDARLVLLGDADQLPSIEAGAVFRDLCAGLGAVRLSVNLRVAKDASARRITEAAHAINAGVVDERFSDAVTVLRSVDEVTFEGVEHLPAPWSDVGDAVLERWWRERVAGYLALSERCARTYHLRAGEFDAEDGRAIRELFDHHARQRILCVTRVRGFAASADTLNDRLLARLRGETRGSRGGRRQRELCAGAPVSVQRNDYERGLYNGDQGVVVRVAADGDDDPGLPAGEGREGELMAVFPRGARFDVFPLDAVGELAPAFAMTVHKAQGSEFDHVAVVLPDQDLPLLTRELLYTAVTRARRSVLLVGEPTLLGRAVSRTVERFSGVAARLKKKA